MGRKERETQSISEVLFMGNKEKRSLRLGSHQNFGSSSTAFVVPRGPSQQQPEAPELCSSWSPRMVAIDTAVRVVVSASKRSVELVVAQAAAPTPRAATVAAP